jgi:hypothetical protein
MLSLFLCYKKIAKHTKKKKTNSGSTTILSRWVPSLVSHTSPPFPSSTITLTRFFIAVYYHKLISNSFSSSTLIPKSFSSFPKYLDIIKKQNQYHKRDLTSINKFRRLCLCLIYVARCIAG